MTPTPSYRQLRLSQRSQDQRRVRGIADTSMRPDPRRWPAWRSPSITGGAFIHRVHRRHDVMRSRLPCPSGTTRHRPPRRRQPFGPVRSTGRPCVVSPLSRARRPHPIRSKRNAVSRSQSPRQVERAPTSGGGTAAIGPNLVAGNATLRSSAVTPTRIVCPAVFAVTSTRRGDLGHLRSDPR